MQKAYELSETEWIELVKQGDTLIGKRYQNKQLMSQVVLAYDVVGEVQGLVYEGELYFLYTDQYGTCYVRSVFDTHIYYEQPTGALPEVPNKAVNASFLCIFGKDLLLLRQKSEGRIEALSLLEDAKPKKLEELISGKLFEQWQQEFYLEKQQLVQQNFKYQELLKQQEKDYQKQLDTLKNRQKEQIASVKKQYEELMEVANQYREEAIKWRSKFW